MSQRRQVQIRKRFQKLITPKLDGWEAVLGDGSGNVKVPGHDNLRYVRPLGMSLPMIVRRGSSPDLEGVRVWVGKGYGRDRALRIIGVVNQNSIVSDLQAHAASHYEGGSDPVWITDRQITPLLCYPSGGLSIRINPGYLVMGGQVVYVAATTLDLTSSIPGAGARYSLVRVSDAGVVDVQDGTSVDSLADLAISNVPDCASGYAVLAFVRLYFGQTILSRMTTAPDVRMLIWGGGLAESEHDAVKIQGLAIDAPEAGDDQKAIIYDHSTTKFIYGEAGSGHTIQADGTPQTERSNLNFVGFEVTDDLGNDATIVEMPSGAYAETIGDGIEVTYVVTHNLGSQDIVVQLWDLSGAAPLLATTDADSITIVDDDSISIVFSDPPDSDVYRAVVLKNGGAGGGASALSELTDVDVPSPADGNVLTFDDGTGKWVPESVPTPPTGDSTYTDAYASRPAASSDGDLFFPNNGFVLERDTGAAWIPWGPIFPLTRPVLADFAWINQEIATAVETGGGIHLLAPANANDDVRLLKMAAPATPYTVTALILPQIHLVNYNQVGLVFRQSSDGKLAMFNFSGQSGGYFRFAKFNSPTSYNAEYSNVYVGSRDWFWLRIADNGTNRICSWSANGIDFIAVHSVGRTDFLTANEIGFYANCNHASLGCALTLLSWKVA